MNPNHTLRRSSFTPSGIFGSLFQDEDGDICAVTLEHSFSNVPKLASGVYTCKRGMHQLLGMAAPFEAFEVQNVPDFQGKPVTGILIHCGNYNEDSEGCILVGEAFGYAMITNSRITFNTFMTKMTGVDEFQLTVI